MGRTVLSKPRTPVNPILPKNRGTYLLALVPVDLSGTPLTFSGGGGGQTVVNGIDPANVTTQAFPWTTLSKTVPIKHGMGCRPSVFVIDSDGNEGVPDVTYQDNDNLTVLLGAPLIGTAYLSRFGPPVLVDSKGDTLTPDVNYTPEATEILTGDLLVYPNDGLGANDGDIAAEDESPTS